MTLICSEFHFRGVSMVNQVHVWEVGEFEGQVLVPFVEQYPAISNWLV